ncbi:hypothetical protein EV426DRAFT_608509 [Tirmania nivea]|nr:hypothetical protein EV426DRAFT_608509 [Tirmania nivea]
MGKPKRTIHALSTLTTSPPPSLPPTYIIAQLVKATGNNLYLVHFPTQLPPHPPVLVEMAPQFRSQIWLRRGGYVVVDTAAFREGEGKEGGKEMKIKGVIVNIVREEKGWRKMSYW